MKDIHELFITHNLVYWAAGGTLLSAVRHQGIAPLDIDLDIFILENDKKVLQKLKKDIKKLGYEFIKKREYVYKIKHPSDIHRDIILMYKENNRFYYSCPILQSNYRRGNFPLYFTFDKLYPLKLYNFGALQIIGPNNPHPYLENAYGKNYKTQAIANLDYRNIYPALPSRPLKDRI